MRTYQIEHYGTPVGSVLQAERADQLTDTVLLDAVNRMTFADYQGQPEIIRAELHLAIHLPASNGYDSTTLYVREVR